MKTLSFFLLLTLHIYAFDEFNPPMMDAPIEVANGLQWQPDSAYPKDIHPWRMAAFTAGSTVAISTGYILFLKNWWGTKTIGSSINAWWEGRPNGPGFSSESWDRANTDKFTHFFMGYYLSNGLYDGIRWTGIEKNPSYILAGFGNLFFQTLKEGRDGLSGRFNNKDLIVGIGSGFFPWLQANLLFLEPMRFRFSYWPHNNQYLERKSDSKNFLKDYDNQDYWMTYPFTHILPHSWLNPWTQGLGLALGTGGYYDGKSWLGFAERRFSVGLDWNLEGYCNDDSFACKRSLFYLGAIKLPNMNVMIYPDVKFSFFYPFLY